jgi:hypothetical protein
MFFNEKITYRFNIFCNTILNFLIKIIKSNFFNDFTLETGICYIKGNNKEENSNNNGNSSGSSNNNDNSNNKRSRSDTLNETTERKEVKRPAVDNNSNSDEDSDKDSDLGSVSDKSTIGIGYNMINTY